jgi:hypothetical protein
MPVPPLLLPLLLLLTPLPLLLLMLRLFTAHLQQQVLAGAYQSRRNSRSMICRHSCGLCNSSWRVCTQQHSLCQQPQQQVLHVVLLLGSHKPRSLAPVVPNSSSLQQQKGLLLLVLLPSQ